MKKSFFVWILFVSIILSTCSLNKKAESYVDRSNDITGIGSVYLYGEMIGNDSAIFTKEYVGIPLLQVLQNLDCSIQWVDSNSAIIEYEETKYTLNLKEISLLDSTSYNIIQPIYGGTMCRKVISNDILLDYTSLGYVLRNMGIQVHIYADYDNLVVNIIAASESE